MVRKITTAKHDEASDSKKRDLDRFGCSLDTKTGVFHVDSRGKALALTSRAEIFARVAFFETATGPVPFLALEISAIRPIPDYCYFPFDLTNSPQRKCFAEIARSGEIKLCFSNGGQILDRTHRLSPYLRSLAAEFYERALRSVELLGKNYEFERALELIEGEVRIPEVLIHLMSEQDAAAIRERIKKAVEKVPSARRRFSSEVIQEAFDTLKPLYAAHTILVRGKPLQLRRAMTILEDLHVLFAGDVDGLQRLLADAVAGTLSDAEIASLKGWIDLASPFVPFLAKVPPKTEAQSRTVPNLPADLSDALRPFMQGRGFSENSLKKILVLLGINVAGSPGRLPKDYSAEYEMKRTMSWTDVARTSVGRDAELQDEFRGANFDSLDLRQQEALKHRIREGVKSYAKRVGKPFPIGIPGTESGVE